MDRRADLGLKNGYMRRALILVKIRPKILQSKMKPASRQDLRVVNVETASERRFASAIEAKQGHRSRSKKA